MCHPSLLKEISIILISIQTAEVFLYHSNIFLEKEWEKFNLDNFKYAEIQSVNNSNRLLCSQKRASRREPGIRLLLPSRTEPKLRTERLEPSRAERQLANCSVFGPSGPKLGKITKNQISIKKHPKNRKSIFQK